MSSNTAIGASVTLPAVTTAFSGFGVSASTTVGGSAPSSSGTSSPASSLASKRVQIMSSVGGSNHTFNTSAEKAVKTMEKVQELYTTLSGKIREVEKLSDDADISINLTRKTYSVIVKGVSVKKPLNDLGIAGSSGVDEAATGVLRAELDETIKKIVDILSESKMVNFGGSSKVASTHQAYVGADSRIGPQNGIGSVVKAIQDGKQVGTGYLVPILQKLFAKEKNPLTLKWFMYHFATVKKYHEAVQEKLTKVLSGGVKDPDLEALQKRLKDTDWVAVAIGVALRLTEDKDGRIADEHMQIVEEAIDVLSPLPSTATKIAQFLSPEKREKAKAEHDSYIAHVRKMIAGQSYTKSLEEALINYSCAADPEETIALGMIFHDITNQQYIHLYEIHASAHAIAENVTKIKMTDEAKRCGDALDPKNPETVKAFVKAMAILLGLEKTISTGAIAAPIRPVSPVVASPAPVGGVVSGAASPVAALPPVTHLTTPHGRVAPGVVALPVEGNDLDVFANDSTYLFDLAGHFASQGGSPSMSTAASAPGSSDADEGPSDNIDDDEDLDSNADDGLYSSMQSLFDGSAWRTEYDTPIDSRSQRSTTSSSLSDDSDDDDVYASI